MSDSVASAPSWTTATRRSAIRSAKHSQVERVPYMLVIGAKEVEAGTVTVRNRDTGESTTMGLEEFIAKVQQETKDRV